MSEIRKGLKVSTNNFIKIFQDDISSNVNLNLGSAKNQPITFTHFNQSDNEVKAMCISGGLVGIGTIEPQSKFHIDNNYPDDQNPISVINTQTVKLGKIGSTDDFEAGYYRIADLDLTALPGDSGSENQSSQAAVQIKGLIVSKDIRDTFGASNIGGNYNHNHGEFNITVMLTNNRGTSGHIKSEMFGHVNGAFTRDTQTRLLAYDQGTSSLIPLKVFLYLESDVTCNIEIKLIGTASLTYNNVKYSSITNASSVAYNTIRHDSTNRDKSDIIYNTTKGLGIRENIPESQLAVYGNASIGTGLSRTRASDSDGLLVEGNIECQSGIIQSCQTGNSLSGNHVDLELQTSTVLPKIKMEQGTSGNIIANLSNIDNNSVFQVVDSTTSPLELFHVTGTGSAKLTHKSSSGNPGLNIVSADVDANVLDIDASQTSGNIINIDSSDLTTGSLFKSNTTSTLPDSSTVSLFDLTIKNDSVNQQSFNAFNIDIDKIIITNTGKVSNIKGLNLVINDQFGNDDNNSYLFGVDTLITNSAGAKNISMVAGNFQSLVNTSATTLDNYGLVSTALNGNSNYGLIIKTSDDKGGYDLMIQSSANPSDHFNIKTVENGATTISTIDYDGANPETTSSLANLTFDIDGDITLDAEGGQILFKDNCQQGAGDIKFDMENNQISFYGDTNTNDFFRIETGASGVSTISTVDSDSNAGHLTLDIDGDINLDSATKNIILKENGNEFLKIFENSSDCVIRQTDGIITFDKNGNEGSILFDITNKQIRFHGEDNLTNYLQIETGTSGATTISTVDSDVSGADLAFEADGDIFVRPFTNMLSLELAPTKDELGTLQFGRQDQRNSEFHRDHRITVMHSDTAANNFMNFSLHPGTGNGTQDPNELLSLQGGDGSVTIKAIRPASGDRTAILRIGDQNVRNQDGKCAKITSTSNDSNNEADLKFFSNNNSTSATEKMRINPNGTIALGNNISDQYYVQGDAQLHIANEVNGSNEFTALRLSNKGGAHSSARSIFDFILQDIDNNTHLKQRKMSIRARTINDQTTWGLTDVSNIMTFDGVTGGVGLKTAHPETRLHIGDALAHTNFFNYDFNALMVTHPDVASNTVLNDPKDVLYLVRAGKNSQAYAPGCRFQLSRFENEGTLGNTLGSRTRLDINLAHQTHFDQSNTTMSIFSNGRVGINTANLTGLLPLSTFHINATDAIIVPVGDTTNHRPSATTATNSNGTAVEGMIRYNTQIKSFEGYSIDDTSNGYGSWKGIGGTIDVDQNTFILTELAAGTDENQLMFYTGVDHVLNTTQPGSSRLQMILDNVNGGLVIGNTFSTAVQANVNSSSSGTYSAPADGLLVQEIIKINTHETSTADFVKNPAKRLCVDHRTNESAVVAAFINSQMSNSVEDDRHVKIILGKHANNKIATSADTHCHSYLRQRGFTSGHEEFAIGFSNDGDNPSLFLKPTGNFQIKDDVYSNKNVLFEVYDDLNDNTPDPVGYKKGQIKTWRKIDTGYIHATNSIVSLSSTQYEAYTNQGAYFGWNNAEGTASLGVLPKPSTDIGGGGSTGKTWIINNRGAGPGGFIIGERLADGTIQKSLEIDGGGVSTFYNKFHVGSKAINQGGTLHEPSTIGCAALGSWLGHNNENQFAFFSHRDHTAGGASSSYALLQENNGRTFLNAASGQNIVFRIQNTNEATYDGTTFNAPSFNTTSDIRFKENVVDLSNSLQKICSIRGVNFNLKGQKRKAAGIIAQEVIDVIPEVVNDKDKDKLSADYNSLVGYLIESVKELKNENDSLKEENNTMKELLVKLNNDVSNIKRELGIRI